MAHIHIDPIIDYLDALYSFTELYYPSHVFSHIYYSLNYFKDQTVLYKERSIKDETKTFKNSEILSIT